MTSGTVVAGTYLYGFDDRRYPGVQPLPQDPRLPRGHELGRPRSPGLFFFQAEDGIRYLTVTGVQTCALPIFLIGGDMTAKTIVPVVEGRDGRYSTRLAGQSRENLSAVEIKPIEKAIEDSGQYPVRSEERRVGEESRSRWWPDH